MKRQQAPLLIVSPSFFLLSVLRSGRGPGILFRAVELCIRVSNRPFLFESPSPVRQLQTFVRGFIRRAACITLAISVLAVVPRPGHAQATAGFEALFYMTNSEASFRSFRDHADQISIVGPQVFSVKGDGIVWGQVDPRVLELAREHGVKVMPLVHNPGFNQQAVHELLNDPEARARAVAALVDLARRHDFYGWQFDFENIHISDRELLTEFYHEAGTALHGKGFRLSIAVVPTSGKAGSTPFHRYMEANWRGSFDLKALAEIGDFISLMTYAQHGTATPPGPVAGLPWVREMLDYALAQGVPPEKLSLGIPTYSGYWYPTYSESEGAHTTGAEIHYDRAMGLIQRQGAELRWLPEQGCHYAFWENTGTFEYLFLEDYRSFRTKLDLFESYEGLRGISVWVLGAEDSGIWDVLRERAEGNHRTNR